MENIIRKIMESISLLLEHNYEYCYYVVNLFFH